MSERNFSNFVESYVEYTKGQEASEKIHRWVAISIIAAAMERKTWLNRDYYTLFPNLYTIIVGASGIVRKSTSTGIGVDLLRSIKDFRIMSERVTAAALIEQMARSGRKFITRTGTEEKQSAVFCYAGELAILFKEVFGSINELLTTFYDCAPNDWRKPWVYETKGEGQTLIHGPCLNILGASTPTWLVRCIPPEEMEGGLSSRIIFVVENDPPKRFIAWPKLDLAAQAMKPKLIADLQRIHALSGEFVVTESAYAWFETWYREHMLSIIASRDPRFAGYFGRKGDIVLKIAMSLSVAERDDLVIEQRHIAQAADWLTSLETSMYDAFGGAGSNSLAALTKKIWNTVRGVHEVSHAQLLKVHWNDVDHKLLISVMETLCQMGMIRIFKETKQNSDGGAATEVIYRATTDKAVRL